MLQNTSLSKATCISLFAAYESSHPLPKILTVKPKSGNTRHNLFEMEESPTDRSVELHIQPPRVRVTKVLRSSYEAPSQTMFECSAKKLHRPTHSSLQAGNADAKNRRLRRDLVKSKSDKTAVSLNKTCLINPTAHESNEASFETQTCHTNIHPKMRGGRLKLGLARGMHPARSQSIVSKLSESAYQSTYQARNKLVKVQKSLLPAYAGKLQPFSMYSPAYTQKSYSFQSLPLLPKTGGKLKPIN
jgi:hypothetical protein